MPSSASGLWKRQFRKIPTCSGAGGIVQIEIDPPPRSRQILQTLSLIFIFSFAALQMLPATHFRNLADRRRNWIPIVANHNDFTFSNTNDPFIGQLSNPKKHAVEIGKINVVSWIDCLDLRLLAVLANSTISCSRLPEHVYFSFYVPENEDVKLSYYKLKVLFPDLNLDLFGQNEVKEKLRISAPEWESLSISINELTPFLIPSTKSSLTKFAFVSPGTIIKGSIEELFDLDLGPYAIAAAEDCSKRLGDYVNINILNAIQRAAAKSWIPNKPYDQHSCIPDLSLFLVDVENLDKNFIESILWWNHVLNMKHERTYSKNIVIAVALYDKYFKLPAAWKQVDSINASSEAKVLQYDGPAMSCSKQKTQNKPSAFGNIWQQYLPPKSDFILQN